MEVPDTLSLKIYKFTVKERKRQGLSDQISVYKPFPGDD